jgi:hypothetical protein
MNFSPAGLSRLVYEPNYQSDSPDFGNLRYPDSAPKHQSGLRAIGGSLENPKGMRVLTGASLVIAILQSLCTAVLTISGIRVAIGLTALAAASGVYAPARGYHQDAIRIPMLIIAATGAIINLTVLAWIWHLRSQPSAQWRKREISRKERRSERLQIVLSIVTLILVGLETWTHTMVHRKGPPPLRIEPTALHSPRAFQIPQITPL